MSGVDLEALAARANLREWAAELREMARRLEASADAVQREQGILAAARQRREAKRSREAAANIDRAADVLNEAVQAADTPKEGA